MLWKSIVAGDVFNFFALVPMVVAPSLRLASKSVESAMDSFWVICTDFLTENPFSVDGDVTPDVVTNYLSWGAGPRASQYLILGAKTLALLDGRLTPDEDDVRSIAVPVLRHRIVTNFNAEAESVTADDIVDRLIELIPLAENGEINDGPLSELI